MNRDDVEVEWGLIRSIEVYTHGRMVLHLMRDVRGVAIPDVVYTGGGVPMEVEDQPSGVREVVRWFESAPSPAVRITRERRGAVRRLTKLWFGPNDRLHAGEA